MFPIIQKNSGRSTSKITGKTVLHFGLSYGLHVYQIDENLIQLLHKSLFAHHLNTLLQILLVRKLTP
jgi:hypothetical protein